MAKSFCILVGMEMKVVAFLHFLQLSESFSALGMHVLQMNCSQFAHCLGSWTSSEQCKHLNSSGGVSPFLAPTAEWKRSKLFYSVLWVFFMTASIKKLYYASVRFESGILSSSQSRP